MAIFRKRSNGWRAEVCKQGIRDSRTFATKGQVVAWATQREVDILAGQGARLADVSLRWVLEKYRDEVSPKKAG